MMLKNWVETLRRVFYNMKGKFLRYFTTSTSKLSRDELRLIEIEKDLRYPYKDRNPEKLNNGKYVHLIDVELFLASLELEYELKYLINKCRMCLKCFDYKGFERYYNELLEIKFAYDLCKRGIYLNGNLDYKK